MSLTIDGDFLNRRPSQYATLRGLIKAPVHLKLEGLNVAGSIKLVPAVKIVRDLEQSGRIRPGSHLIESSSGNLGIALAVVCANSGYPFTCVTDPNASTQAGKAMTALGARVIVVDERDQHGGYLNTRLRVIQQMCERDPTLVWVNQYANESNCLAHYNVTAQEIHSSFGKVDWLLIGTGTTGTLMGCGRFFKEHAPATRIVAVDAAGSVTFGGKPGKRYLPGIGTTRTPEIMNRAWFDELVYVQEADAIRMCREVARRGLLIGGSTGSVLVGVELLAERISADDTVVAISPDMAEKYLSTIFDDEWTSSRFPDRRAHFTP